MPLEGDEDDDDDAAESVLGTKPHWDATYDKELARFSDSGGKEVGDVWFGEDVLTACAAFASSLAADNAHAWRVLDLGCGNGTLLHALWGRGFRRLEGSDYSAAAVELSRRVLAAASVPVLPGPAGPGSPDGVTLHVDDLFESALAGPYDLVIDKGTFDAVGLSAGRAHKRAAYRECVAAMLRRGGLLVITSCNDTLAELRAFFESESVAESVTISPRYEFVDAVRSYPTFRFGGVEGTKVATGAWRRV